MISRSLGPQFGAAIGKWEKNILRNVLKGYYGSAWHSLFVLWLEFDQFLSGVIFSIANAISVSLNIQGFADTIQGLLQVSFNSPVQFLELFLLRILKKLKNKIKKID